jgi:serine/threonine-protein kinase RsbW
METEATHEVELCAVEAVTNAIRHAYRNEPDNEVSLTLNIRDDRLELEVVDTGTAMSPAQQQKLAEGSDVLDFDPSDHATLPEGGMGLQIIHKVMDEVSYKQEAGVNSLQLIRLIRAVEDRCGSSVTPHRAPVQLTNRKVCAKGPSFG